MNIVGESNHLSFTGPVSAASGGTITHQVASTGTEIPPVLLIASDKSCCTAYKQQTERMLLSA